MFDIIRESTLGEIVNRASGGRFLPYPDQRADFVVPERYLATSTAPSGSRTTTLTRNNSYQSLKEKLKTANPSTPGTADPSENVTRVVSEASIKAPLPAPPHATDSAADVHGVRPAHPVHPHDPFPFTPEPWIANRGADVEVGDLNEKNQFDGPDPLSQYILVEWYGDDDPENPRYAFSSP